MKKVLAMFLLVLFIPCFVSAESSMTDEEYVHAYFSEVSDEQLYALNIATQIELDSRGISTSETGLSNMTYDELVMLKDRINIALWNSQEWQEVIVPQGVWLVGEDIPEGHWSITCAGGYCTDLSFGTCLDETGRNIDGRKTDFYISDSVYGTDSVFFDPLAHKVITDVELRNGTYVIIKISNAIFTPYAGKPSLGFK